jgi:hypothetical protein
MDRHVPSAEQKIGELKHWLNEAGETLDDYSEFRDIIIAAIRRIDPNFTPDAPQETKPGQPQTSDKTMEIGTPERAMKHLRQVLQQAGYPVPDESDYVGMLNQAIAAVRGQEPDGTAMLTEKVDRNTLIGFAAAQWDDEKVLQALTDKSAYVNEQLREKRLASLAPNEIERLS